MYHLVNCFSLTLLNQVKMKAVYYLFIALLAEVALAEEGDATEKTIEPTEKAEAAELSPGGEPYVVKSINYPKNSPLLLNQTWELTTQPANVIKLKCTDLRFQNEDSKVKEEPCDDYVFLIEDEGGDLDVCTESHDYNFTSKTNFLSLELLTSSHTSGFLDCIATAVAK